MARAKSSQARENPDLPPAETLPYDPDLEDRDRPLPKPVRAMRHRQWDILAMIALGGGLGSTARYGLARALPTPAGGFPWATFTANVVGSLALGLLMVYILEVWPPSRYVRPFLGVGLIGGFTTFSTYTVEMRGLLADHQWSLADAYALTSLIAGLAAVWTGIVVGRRAGGLPVRRGPSRRSQAGRPAAPQAPAAPQPSPEGRPR